MRHANRMSTLSRMIDLRRLPAFRAGARLPKAYADAWDKDNGSAEVRILEIAELAYLLQADGFPIREIFRRIGLVLNPPPNLDRAALTGKQLRPYVVDHLQVNAPGYLQLGGNLLQAALCIAELWAELAAERSRGSNWPTPVMIEAPGPLAFVSPSGVFDEIGDVLPLADDPAAVLDRLVMASSLASGRDWRRLRSRLVPGDELRTYSTGALSFDLVAGSAGVALVRAGRAIGHVEIMQN